MFVPPWLHTLQRCWFPRRSSKARNTARGASAHRRCRPSLEYLEDRLAPSADAVQTIANNLSTPFSVSQQNLTLSANVSDTTNSGTTVSEGTVTFTVEDSGGHTVGSSVQGTVSGGKASANYALPGGEAAGNYTIHVSYDDSATGTFTDGGDTAGALTVNPATVKVAGGNSSASFSSSNQSVTLTASVTDDSFPSDTVGEGSVTFTVKNSSGSVIGSSTQGTVSGGKASATFALPANTTPGSYTVAVAYIDSNGNLSDDSTDTAGKLTVSAAATTTQAASATTSFSSSDQQVTLTATVSSSGGTVNEGSVLYTVVDSNGNTIGTPISGLVSGGSASVSYTVPGGTAAGNYTIEAAYSDNAGTFSSSLDATQSLGISAASATSVSLTSASITPNLLGGKAQVTLTAQVSNPSGTVSEGVLSFAIGGVSDQVNVTGGTATVQLSVPIQTVFNGFIVSLSYTDNASAANFAGVSSSESVSTSILNALLPANLTFDSSSGESMKFTVGSLPLLGASYSSSTGLLSALSIGSLSMPVMYTNVGNIQVATVDGAAWGIIFHDTTGNFLGIADVEPGADGSLNYVVHDAHNNVIGEFPYS